MKKKVILRISLGISLILTGILTSRVMFTSAAGDFESGKGTEKDPYIITNAEQLQNVGKYCGKDNAKYFKIDIKGDKLDMKDIQNFKPICSIEDKTEKEGRYNNSFYGHFDGNNTELINLKIETDGFFGGLFGGTNGATIKNIGIGKNSYITVKTTSSTGISPTGGIIGEAWKTKIENVWNHANITGAGTRVGGIVGAFIQESTIKKADNYGLVKAGKNNKGYSLAGGIAGYASINALIENVTNTANVIGDGSYVGGIVGALQGYSKDRNTEGTSILKNAKNKGEVRAGKDNGGNSTAGGIAGNAFNALIENVTNTANVTGDGSYVGGIAGYASTNSLIENVSNIANVTGDGACVGGIVGALNGYSRVDGQTEGESKVINARNEGEVRAGKDNDGKSLAGGIAGYAINNVSIEDVTNIANVTGDGSRVGGIVGETNTNSTLKNIRNEGEVKAGKENDGWSLAGGIAGNASSNALIENVTNTANVIGDGSYVGGIVGYLQGYSKKDGETEGESKVINAKNEGAIEAGKENDGDSLAGGIAGYASSNALIENVTNTANVTGEGARVGGIVGELSEYSTLRNALNYNENITGSEYVGLLIGIMVNDSIATATNAYTLKENTTLNGVGWYHNEYSKITSMKGFTKEEMKNKENFVGFDFDNIWIMGSEHPELERKIIIDGGETISGTGGSGNTEITIKYNTNTINVSNYLYKNRTYVDLYTFCSESGICEVHKDKENEKIYKILKSESLTSADGQKKYHYLVEHESGTSNFKSTILIGGRSVVDDINTQLSTDVKSCPIEVTDSKYQCDGNTIYVPVRFLTQALGLRVEWDGDTSTVTIKDNFEKSFNDVYTPIITEGECEGDISSCTLIEKNSEGNYELKKDKTYYLGTMKKDDKTIMKFKKFFSFYEEPNGMSVTKTGGEEPYTYTRFTFSIRGPEIKVGGSREQREDIAQIIMYEIASGEGVHDAGSYPMLINGSFTVK